MYRVTREPHNDNDWNIFIFKNNSANVFQSKWFSEAVSKFYDVINLFCYDADNNLKGMLNAYIEKQNLGSLSFISTRCIIEGGPILGNNNNKIAEALLGEMINIVRKKTIFILARNFFETKDIKSAFVKNGFNYIKHLNILVNLTKSEDELWKEVHSKRRNEIRKAKKNGVTFEDRRDFQSLQYGYEVLIKVYKRVGLPFPKLNYFKEVLDKSTETEGLRIFCAMYNGQIIGVMFALCYLDTIFDWYAGAKQDYYSKNPNDLIPWEVFLWGKRNGYSLFDFGGAGKPDVPYGVRDYKLKFGGELVDFGRYLRINKPYLYKIGERGLKFYKRVKNII